MQRRYITILLVLTAAMAFSAPVWGGDPAAKSAADDLDKGYQAAKRGYWQEALARYDHASKMTPGNAEVWSNLAVALEAVGRWDDAGEAYRKALEVDPGNSRIRKNVALYNEFYASYIAEEDSGEKESEPVTPDEPTNGEHDSAAADESPEGGADDAQE